jgi:SSS family solute:Na+ symporter
VASVVVKVGALAIVVLLDPQFAVDLQLIAGILTLQAAPTIGLGLMNAWFHRWALFAGMLVGLTLGVAMVYQTPQLGGADGRTIVREHFGGSSWALANLGLDTDVTVYAGLLSVVVNLLIATLGTVILRVIRVARGIDATKPSDYLVNDDGPTVQRLTELLDGTPVADLSAARFGDGTGGAHSSTHPQSGRKPRQRRSRPDWASWDSVGD